MLRDDEVAALRATGRESVTLPGEGTVMGAMDAGRVTGGAGASAGEAAERAHLLAQGFSAAETERLIAQKRRLERRLPEGVSEKRLRFVRWLVVQGRLGDGVPSRSGT